MSLQPFQAPQQGAQDSSGPLGASGALGASGVLGAQDAGQYQQQQQDLAAITAQQEQAAQQEQSQKKDTSHGWSLTNPLQDLGQVWHDVETHTVVPAMHAANWAAVNLVKRPVTTMMLVAGHREYAASHHENASWFQGSVWGQAWDQSNHISPGNATVLAANDASIPGVPEKVTWGDTDSHKYVDPLDIQARQAYQNDPKNQLGTGMKLSSGGMDTAIDWYGDPTVRLGQGIKLAKGLRDAPILASDTEEQAIAKFNTPNSLAAQKNLVGQSVNTLVEHPLVAGAGGQANPLKYKTAALIAGAKTPEDVGSILQVMAAIPSKVTGMSVLAGDVSPADKVLDKLGQQSPDMASQISSVLMPIEFSLDAALSPAGSDELEQWLQKVSQKKANAVQASLNVDPERAQQILSLLGTGGTKTTSSALTNRLAALRGALKYKNLRTVDGVTTMHNAFYNFPLRVYHGLTDRPEGLINHSEDSDAEVARSWLNKSSTLTPEQKVGYIQQYTQAARGDRQRVWDNVEKDVYNKVGERFGLDADTMKDILTTTKTKQGRFVQSAVSRAYGGAKAADGSLQAALPSFDDTMTLAPKYITQLEAGAKPLANLHNLENALGALSRNPDSILAVAGRVGSIARDTIVDTLDKTYGIWKPASLLTGHRAYNHNGDDFLRGLAKIGAVATIQNAAGGAANFLRNSYARATNLAVIRNTQFEHAQAISEAKAAFEGLKAQQAAQRTTGLKFFPDDLRIKASDIKAKKDVYDSLKNLELDFIQPKHRLGERDFTISGSQQKWPEMFAGPNGDWARKMTSSHATFDHTVDGMAGRNHAMLTAINSRDFGTISATEDNLAKHTAAYVHYVRNQMLPDPVAKQILAGRDLNDVAGWLTKTSAGRAHAKALHIGDPHDWVHSIAEDIQTHLPFDGMKDDAAAGKFSAKTIEAYMPDAGMRPNVSGRLNSRLYGGDDNTSLLKTWTSAIMKWTGSVPDDILVRHPLVNSMYKMRLADNVQSWMAKTGQELMDGPVRDQLIKNSILGARKDLQNLVYDSSRFTDMGHMLRFVSPFFNAWFNAMSSWSKLFIENPTLLGRTYQAKRALWNSPFTIDNTTGQKATADTPWDQTSFMMPLPRGLAASLGDFSRVNVSAKTLISPTYIDSIGNPGWGPLVSVPANQIILDHPALMNSPVFQSMLNNMVDKNSMAQLLPSPLRDVASLTQLISANPDDAANYAKNVWSIYQEQQYDYQNGKRSEPPKWPDVKNTAFYLTALDLFANRLSPLGFKPTQNHQFLIDEYKRMLAADPKNATQNFYQKYPSAMVFTQSLTTNPSGVAATVGASTLVKKYSSLLAKHPDLAAVIVGPNGNGNFNQMAYEWQVAEGLRSKLTPEQAAQQADVNAGWAEYDKRLSAVRVKLQARGIASLNDPQAKSLKAELTNYVAQTGDPHDPYYNRHFYDNFSSFDPATYETRMQGLFQIAQEPALLSNATRSDIRSLQAYTQLRDNVYALLQARPNKSLNSSRNADVAQFYDNKVADLMNADSKFAQLYDRYLRKDDFKEPLH